MSEVPRLVDVVVGAFLVGGALALAFLLALGGLEPNYLRHHNTYTVVMSEGYGIGARMDVTVSGRRVGYVQTLRLNDDRTVHVELRVEEQYASLVHEDSYVDVLRTLNGASMEITPGKGPIAANGATLPGGDNVDPLVLVQDVAELLPSGQGLLMAMAHLLPEVDLTLQAAGQLPIIRGKFKKVQRERAEGLNDDAKNSAKSNAKRSTKGDSKD